MGLALALSACGAHHPTTQLVDARLAYQQASIGNAAQYAPGSLLEARQSLDAAETAYRNHRNHDYQRYTAHVALRSAQLATERGNANAQRVANERAQAARTAQLQQQADAARAELAQRDAQLEAEKSARAQTDAALSQAEREKNDAIASLRELAAIQETERGIVITLAGSLLFTTDEATLLPLAQERLDRVAAALRTLAGNQTLVIEGYTDSTGTRDYNRRLSGARADAVRGYLVSRGVSPEQVVAVAKGEDDPVASNDTAEGRANNRRVEIVISRPSVPVSAQR